MHCPMPPPELDFIVMEVTDIANCSDDDQRDMQLVSAFMTRCGVTSIRRINGGLGVRYVGGVERGVKL